MTSVQANQDTALMAHLLRRASFGATPEELELATERGYENTVEDLLNPVEINELPEDLIRRYHVDQSDLRNRASGAAYWVYRMVNSKRPLEEKMALFWHRVFATAATKLIQARVVTSQIEMFRNYGMGSFRDLLVQLSKDPAMLMWLDNQDNHKESINENFGRGILELFSMGAGNYSEDDIKECARAFTGWRVVNTDYMAIKMRNNTARPYGYIAWQFEYDEEDHDHGIKNFLGESGDFNGEDVIDIICKQDATPRFLARQLYHYFVADEPPVPQWPLVEPRDPKAIDLMVKAYFESDYSIGAMLRVMFNSEFFKAEDARFARIKSPAEMVVGMLRLAGDLGVPSLETYAAASVSANMGQDLLNPPSVEGWQGGEDWINTGAYVQRINFASKVMGDSSKSGVQSLVKRVEGQADNSQLTPENLVDSCLNLLGPIPLLDTSRRGLIDYAGKWGNLRFDSPEAIAESEKHIIAMLQLVVTTQEYQMV